MYSKLFYLMKMQCIVLLLLSTILLFSSLHFVNGDHHNLDEETNRLVNILKNETLHIVEGHQILTDFTSLNGLTFKPNGTAFAINLTKAEAPPGFSFPLLGSMQLPPIEEHRNKLDKLQQILPPKDDPTYLIKQKWVNHIMLHKSVSPDLVVQLGRIVHIIDIRTQQELLGPVGYIRGSNWFPVLSTSLTNEIDIAKIADAFPRDGLIAVVSSNESQGRAVVRELRKTGHHFAALLTNGVKGFKLLGFTTSRESSIIERREVPYSVLYQKQQQLETTNNNTNMTAAKDVTLQHIISHLGNGDSLQSIKLAAFLTHGRLSCIDGRDDGGIIGTPGGDLGDHILLLSVIEEAIGKSLTDLQIALIFQRRLDSFGRFYAHSDAHALEHFIDALRQEVNPHILDDDIGDVPPDYIFSMIFPSRIRGDQLETTLEILTRPESTGCGHLKQLLINSERYNIRQGLVRSALKEFFRTLWLGAQDIDFVVLSGNHQECGVANVKLNTEIHSYTKIPLIPPSNSINHKQIFINHGQISQYLRNEKTQWLLEQTDVIPELAFLSKDTVLKMVDKQAAHHKTLTVTKLATGLPMYTVNFDESHSSCVVHFDGFVGGVEGPIDHSELDHKHEHEYEYDSTTTTITSSPSSSPPPPPPSNRDIHHNMNDPTTVPQPHLGPVHNTIPTRSNPNTGSSIPARPIIQPNNNNNNHVNNHNINHNPTQPISRLPPIINHNPAPTPIVNHRPTQPQPIRNTVPFHRSTQPPPSQPHNNQHRPYRTTPTHSAPMRRPSGMIRTFDHINHY